MIRSGGCVIGLEAAGEDEAEGERFGGMEMDVWNTFQGLAGQPGRVKIVDVVVAAVQKVEGLECDGPVGTDAAADLGADEGGGVGADGVVLQERAGSEVAQAEASVKAPSFWEGESGGYHPFGGAGDAISGRVVVAEPGMGPGHVQIADEPGAEGVIIGPLEPEAAAGAAGLGGAGISEEEQFAVDVENPKGQGALETVDPGGSEADLGGSGGDERIHRTDGLARGGVEMGCGAASVVAVKSEPGVQVELGASPWAEGQADLGGSRGRRMRGRC